MNPETLVREYKDTFERLDEIISNFQHGTYGPNDVDAFMKELAGIYASLNNRVTDLEVDRLGIEAIYGAKRKEELEAMGKVSMTQLDRELQWYTIEHTKAIRLFQGRLDSSDKLISICQSSLKSLDRERRLP